LDRKKVEKLPYRKKLRYRGGKEELFNNDITDDGWRNGWEPPDAKEGELRKPSKTNIRHFIHRKRRASSW